MRTRAVTDLARLAAPALVGAATFAGVGTLGAAAPASAAGACSGTSGVTVVVQFPSGSATGCAPGSPGTALNALRSAGFSTTGVVGYGDAFICSINGYPIKTMCPRTPPANAYWAVFSAKRGGSWTYANVGAAALPAPSGSAVGFRFGSGAAPSVAVPKAASTPSTSKPSAPKSSSSKPTAPATKRTGSASTSPSHDSASSTGSTKHGSAAKDSASSTHAQPKQSATPSSASRSSSASATAGSTTAPRPSASGTAPGQGATSSARVASTKIVEKDGTKRKIVVFDDGSSLTLDPNSADAKKYEVGVPKEGGKGTVAAPTSTSVPQPSNSSHPSISTSGSVPGMPVPEAKQSGGGNMAGVLTGVGVLGVATAGAGYAASRRRG